MTVVKMPLINVGPQVSARAMGLVQCGQREGAGRVARVKMALLRIFFTDEPVTCKNANP